MVTQEEVEEPYNNDFHASNSRGRRDVATAWTAAPPTQVARAESASERVADGHRR
jgi:hypothetical protein